MFLRSAKYLYQELALGGADGWYFRPARCTLRKLIIPYVNEANRDFIDRQEK